MTFELPNLPYAYDDLEPYIDSKTMEIHHSKHHATYVQKLNDALGKYPDLAKKEINEILKNINSVPIGIKTAVINHGGGHSNHSFFWNIITPDKKKRELKGKIAEAIKKEFGSFDEFKKKFSEAALARFGSGWAWLVLNGDELEIYSTGNQDSPIMGGKTPLLGLDVWEHAYYIKWNSDRKGYVENWWNVVNWERVNELYEKKA